MFGMRRMNIRLSHQIHDYYCGPAVIVTVLRAYGIRTTQKHAARLARTNKKIGTSTKGLTSALRTFGVRVRAGNGQTLQKIRGALKAGTIVVVCYTEPSENVGHYAVVAGFRGRTILLFSPDERGQAPVAMEQKEFLQRWKDPLFTRSTRWAVFTFESG